MNCYGIATERNTTGETWLLDRQKKNSFSQDIKSYSAELNLALEDW